MAVASFYSINLFLFDPVFDVFHPCSLHNRRFAAASFENTLVRRKSDLLQ